MLSPIAPVQSTEVRRVDEVTPRKYVAARVGSPLTETEEGVRITIGDHARRLANRQPAPDDAAPSGDDGTPSSGVQTAGTAERLFRGSPLPLAFKSAEASLGQAAQGTDANELANRALQAFSVIGSAVNEGRGPESAFAELEAERVFGPEETLKVPFEVFQRAVTQATARGGDSGSAKGSVFAPIQSVFSAPENGGAPYGRAVPFEADDPSGPPYITAAEDTEESSSSRTLSQDDVDQLISELSWSLPQTGSGVSSAAA